MTKAKKQQQLRLRVFAGPNGSGKSTVIERIKEYRSAGELIDFGFYINADDIAVSLRELGFSFDPYGLKVDNKHFRTIALESGLVNESFPEPQFTASYFLRMNVIKLRVMQDNERLAQIIADYLRKRLLADRKKFSFETVFSHPSKLEIMRQAADAGYKVYLYFVSTESPTINIFRVAARTEKGGHSVPPATIKSRYQRSLDLLFEASQLAYQAYYFDNSKNGEDFTMFAHFKKRKDKKKWDPINRETVPSWFKTYYLGKVKESKEKKGQ